MSTRTSEEMLFIGQRCSHSTCNLVDFLPLKCRFCLLPYCDSHFPLSTHDCPNRPGEWELDRRTPLCPLCDRAVPSSHDAPGERGDVNAIVERHIRSECQGKESKKLEFERKREKGEVCFRKNCGKVLFVKIRCESCKRDYCPSHRYPNQHLCPSLSSSSSATPSTSTARAQQINKNLAAVNTSNPLLAKLRARQSSSSSPSSQHSSSSSPSSSSHQSSNPPPPTQNPQISAQSLTHLPFGARREAALAAFRRVGAGPGPASASGSGTTGTTGASSKETTGTTGTSSGTGTIAEQTGDPFDLSALRRKFNLNGSGSDKQAKAELESIFRSLENRHRKGILGKNERVRYAEMCAHRENARRMGAGGKEGDCLIA